MFLNYGGESIMDNTDKVFEEVQIRISDDYMSAYIFINPDSNNVEGYTPKRLIEELNGKGVVYGIKQDVIDEICEKKIFYIECLVAEGTAPVFGEPGYYKIPFSYQFDRKPKILEDGSVDYNQFDNYCKVSAGEVIAEYVHATKGCNGMDVQGKKIFGKNGKEQMPLKGKGFKLDEDNPDIYIATMDGRFEYEENRSINISNLYDVNGDVNYATGDIQFPGDVHIHGNVTDGATVRASGQIIVDGCVESAKLYAGQDVILKNGMQGAGKGILVSRGNVSAKFFEHTVIKAEGKILAGAIMNCDTESKESVIVSGKIGALIGGTTKAAEMVEASVIGNMSESKTSIIVGYGAELTNHMSENQVRIEEAQGTIDKLTEQIDKIEAYLKVENKPELAAKKMEMIKLKFIEKGNLDKLMKIKKDLTEHLIKSKRARVCVHKSIYPRVSIKINDITLINKSENYNVTYLKRGGNIEFVPNP